MIKTASFTDQALEIKSDEFTLILINEINKFYLFYCQFC